MIKLKQLAHTDMYANRFIANVDCLIRVYYFQYLLITAHSKVQCILVLPCSNLATLRGISVVYLCPNLVVRVTFALGIIK